MSSMLENWFGRGASELPPPIRISLLSQGTIISTSLALAAELGMADLLADGPRSSEELAQATSTHPRSLYRLLRLLCSIGVFTEIQTDSFAQTPLSECLRTGVPGSMRSWLRMIGLKTRYHTHAEALYSIKTGEPAFKRGNGMEFFDYLAAHPDEGKIFNQAMNDIEQVVAAAVAQSYDADRSRHCSDLRTPSSCGSSYGAAALLLAIPGLTACWIPAQRAAKVNPMIALRCESLRSVPQS
jgi:hypothetical protein